MARASALERISLTCVVVSPSVDAAAAVVVVVVVVVSAAVFDSRSPVGLVSCGADISAARWSSQKRLAA